MGQPFKLFRLQLIDTHLDKVKKRLHAIEAALNQDEPIRRANVKVDKSSKNLQEATKALQKIEQQVEAQQAKIEETESALYSGSVHNPKELQDLNNEAQALKRYLTVLEDRQIEAMLTAEDAEHHHAMALAYFRKVQAETIEKNAGLIGEQSRLNKDLERQKIERQAIASSIPVEDLELYENLRQQRSGVAVAKVTDRACSACGTTLNAALLQATRSPNQIVRCTTCSRILYSQ